MFVPSPRQCPRGCDEERGRMIQKLISALILAPLAILFVVCGGATGQTVVFSFARFAAAHPLLSGGMRLFALFLLLVLGGVVVGGVAAWLGRGEGRWRARHFEAEARS